MSKPLKIGLYVLAAPFVLYCIYQIFIWLMIIVFILFGAVRAKEFKIKILYQTDHQKLLDACRELLNEGYYDRFEVKNRHEPNNPKYPKEILDLKAPWVDIYDSNCLIIVASGGMYRLGVVAYAKDFNGTYSVYMDRKLIDGLWYFDDGYRNDPNYDRYLESLRPKK